MPRGKTDERSEDARSDGGEFESREHGEQAAGSADTRPHTVRSTPDTEGDPVVAVVGDESAVGLATYLRDDCRVRLVSDDGDTVRRATSRGFEAYRTDIGDGERLRSHVDAVDAAMVATGRDRTTFLVAHLLQSVCGVAVVGVRVNDPEHRELFDGIDGPVLNEGSLLGEEVTATLFEEEHD